MINNIKKKHLIVHKTKPIQHNKKDTKVPSTFSS